MQTQRKFDYVHERFDEFGVTEGERLYIMQQNMIEYFSKCEQWDDMPNMRRFLNDHEEWDDPKWHNAVEKEFKHQKSLTPKLGRMEA